MKKEEQKEKKPQAEAKLTDEQLNQCGALENRRFIYTNITAFDEAGCWEYAGQLQKGQDVTKVLKDVKNP